jgi:hypothetical protein
LLHATLPYDRRSTGAADAALRATFLLWVGADSRLGSVASLLDAARRAPGASYATPATHEVA